MIRKYIAVFGLSVLAAACAQQTEEPVELDQPTSTITAPEPQVEVEEAQEQPADVGIIPGSRQDFIANVGDTVYFDYNKSELRSDAILTLNRQANWLTTYDTYTLTVEGHADERGTREYNLALGERRASAVRDYLVDNGVDNSRISVISYGEERPVALGNDETSWSQNRRTQTVLD